MRLPTDRDYRELYQTYHTPPHIQDHMRVVANIAVVLARYHEANIALAEAAAKLHDLVRLPEQWPYLPNTIATPLPHAEINYLLLRDRWPEVAQIIRPHSLMSLLQSNALTTSEAKIVYYADKRVNHADIVTLEERLQFGQTRWRVTPSHDRTAELLPQLQALETQLFTPLPFAPHELKNKLKTSNDVTSA